MSVPGQQAVGLLESTIGLIYLMLFLFSPVIEEGGVKMKLTVIDTPGFGDQINNENWYASACEILFLNTLLGKHNADSFPFENYLHPPGKEAGSPGRILSLLTIHGEVEVEKGG